MMKTLFLHPPSFDGFDGGAGSRYQARREIRSFWYPTWLAQPAALVPDSRLIDAPPAKLKLADVLPVAGDYELAVLHTSTPSFASDVRVAEALKEENPRLKIGMVGAKVAVEPEDSLKASSAIDFVAREEFDFTIREVAEGRPLDAIDGLSFRSPNGAITHNPDRSVLTATGKASVRQRDLPAHVVVYYVIALALYMQTSYREVLRCLLEGIQWLLDPSVAIKVAGKSGISQARTRLGWEPLCALHDAVVTRRRPAGTRQSRRRPLSNRCPGRLHPCRCQIPAAALPPPLC